MMEILVVIAVVIIVKEYFKYKEKEGKGSDKN